MTTSTHQDFTESLTVVVRFLDRTDGIFKVNPSESVGDLIQKVKASHPSFENQYIRIIYNGQLLQPQATFNSCFSLNVPSTSDSQPTLPQRSPVYYVHCAVSPNPPSQPSPESETSSPFMNGLERLRDAGFTSDDINMLRLRINGLQGQLDNGDSEEEVVQTERPEILEDELYVTFRGICLGFFLNILVLFWMRERVFSRREQMSIILGLLFNVGFGVLHLYAT